MNANRIGVFFLFIWFSSVKLNVAHAGFAFGGDLFDAGDVLLDFTDFDLRLAEVAAEAGATPFSASEQATIESSITSKLSTAFSDFGRIAFSTTPVGGPQPTINFGLTATPGSLGVADHIDFLNLGVADTARVFSGNFGFIVESGDARATQISELTAALGGTAAHEVGHNLGLRHHDAYSNLTYTGTPIATGGSQNANIMATGSTGLTEEGRETDRVFSKNSIVKLAYAAGSLESNPTAIPEGADAGATTGTATALTLDNVTVGSFSFESKVVQGDLTSTSDVDIYSFSAIRGQVLTADMNNDYFSGSTATNANTAIEIIGPGGLIVAADDVSRYTATTFGSGSSGDGFDPAVFNVPIDVTGTYFVRVFAEDSNIGDYTLLIHTSGNAVPEPSAFALMGLVGVVATGTRYVRRRKMNG